jgi:hypothetical protein
MSFDAGAPKSLHDTLLLIARQVGEKLIVSAVGAEKGDIRMIINCAYDNEAGEINEREFSRCRQAVQRNRTRSIAMRAQVAILRRHENAVKVACANTLYYLHWSGPCINSDFPLVSDETAPAHYFSFARILDPRRARAGGR